MSSISAAKINLSDSHPFEGWISSAARLAVFFAFCYALFFGVRQYFLHNGQPLDISRAQAVAFPVFGFFVLFLSRTLAPLRSLVIIGCVAAGLFGVLYSYNYHLFAASSFMVATFSDDPYSSESRIFRKAIERESKRTHGIGIAAYYETLSNSNDANDVLSDDDLIKGVVWGSRRWLNVTFGDKVQSLSIDALAPTWGAQRFGSIKIVSRVPWIGLSYKPVPETAEFLSALFHDSPEMLLHAAQLEAPWTSYAHRGAAYLALGNYYFKEAMRSNSYNPAVMDCVISYYRAGTWLVSSRDNHELRSALLNNLGVALYIQGTFERVVEMRKEGRAYLASAIKIPQKLKQKAPSFTSPKIALENFRAVRTRHRKQ